MVYKSKKVKLAKELTGLRKGGGLSPHKLQKGTLLRGIIGQILRTPADSITNNQLYDTIITHVSALPQSHTTIALRHALGIDKSSDKLAQRRLHAAKLLKKHPDTIERYENKAFELLASNLLDASATSTTTESHSQEYFEQLEEKTKVTREIAVLGLGSHLSIGHGANDLMRTLETPYLPYLNATVSLTFLPSYRGSEWYRFQLRRSFQGKRSTFRVAVVLHEIDGEELLNAGLVDDFHKLNSSRDPEREIKTIIATSKFTIKHQGTKKLLRLSKLDQTTASQLLRSTSLPASSDCWILEVAIPPELQGPEVSFEHQSVINLRTDEHYAYWYSPGLTQLKKLTVDFSQFPDADKWKFFIQPFLGNVSGYLDDSGRVFSISSQHWILPGHGIALIWQ